jgi:hypothetical protein
MHESHPKSAMICMSGRRRTGPIFVVLLHAAFVMTWYGAAWAQDSVATDVGTDTNTEWRPVGRSWTINSDNDLFVGSGLDRDYTGGISLTLSHPVSPDERRPGQWALDRLDRWSGLAAHLSRRSAGLPVGRLTQFGVLAFTPQRLDSTEPEREDRPYASMLYVTESRFRISDSGSRVYQSSLTAGLLGTSAAEQLHRKIHSALGLRVPEGYGRQISAGGELTGRYVVSRHSLLRSQNGERAGHDLSMRVEGSVGFLTEGVWNLGLRWGRRGSPWWSSPSDHGEYAGRALPRSGARHGPESYLTAGVALRIRLYNALLQGQVRATQTALSHSEVLLLVAEAWLGGVRSFGSFVISYTIRFQTPEIRTGFGARNQLWASLALGRTF